MHAPITITVTHAPIFYMDALIAVLHAPTHEYKLIDTSTIANDVLFIYF